MGFLPHAACVTVALISGLVYTLVVRWMGSVSEVQDFTAAQLGTAVAFGFVFSAWVGAEAGFFLSRLQPRYESVGLEADGEEDEEAQKLSASSSPPQTRLAEPILCGVPQRQLAGLRAAGEFVLIMGYVYLCDRTPIFAKGAKEVSPTRFWMLNLAILLAGLCTLRAASREPDMKPLQRDQTEEWKGWMQLMFILYHYFAEAEIYNAIRIYIAAYVWMTGFGNFSYYYIKEDFTLPRFTQMMWRLNFFVFFVCATMNNEYMLYYICPMHTFFTWAVYFTCWVASHLNQQSNVFCAVKISATLALTVALYDVPGVFHKVFAPFTWLFAFHDPLHPEFTDSLHEWFFRSGLDHFVWIFGMVCALSFPWFARQMAALEELATAKRLGAKACLLMAVLALGGWWGARFFALPKRAYNVAHPITSWIPILCYIVLRNMSPLLRRYYMHLFTWCGKVTLETYILQFHIWMKTTGLNGSPKHLMVWLPGWYWTNFALTSAVFLFISYRVFQITVVLRDVCIPRESGPIIRRAILAAGMIAGFYAIGTVLKSNALAAPA